jgi:hypothetical protein
MVNMNAIRGGRPDPALCIKPEAVEQSIGAVGKHPAV